MIRRREFIAGLGGAAAWPLAARGQQGRRLRRIGVLLPPDENDPVWKRRYSAFIEALSGLGWTNGRNVRIDLRWGGGDSFHAKQASRSERKSRIIDPARMLRLQMKPS
jgi:putative ABC transport system substrate-binding protein